ncbi:MAG: 4-hydroxythreonine-4-phosphate dehydrogenase PdxA [bacterium]|nr:4-hydroxythreonine-4-phosphate dehydrogenase PdxA [Candidatus Kapabacteria bacterium]
MINADGDARELRPRILFTVGDVNGIGIEILLRALCDPSIAGSFHPVIVGNRRLVTEYLATAKALPPDLLLESEFVEIDSDAVLRFGVVDASVGRLAYDAIVAATNLALDGSAQAIVTMPISKEGLHAAGCEFTAHTELIASIVRGNPTMILMTEGMLVALATIHVPIANVASLLTFELIEMRLRQLESTLRSDFGCAQPRIAVLGLNPHSGENGLLGREELDVIAPAVRAMRDAGVDITGPVPADGFFARYTPGRFDGILAMYHDQGLIPLKLFARGGGVNFTAGLPIVRTSPDHGTAFDIAGRGMADHQSVVEAIAIAMRVVRNRHAAVAREIR